MSGLQAGIDSADAGIAVIDRNWDIQITNPQWISLARDTGCIPAPGQNRRFGNYLHTLKGAIALGDDTALKTFIGITSVMNGDEPDVTVEFPCIAMQGVKNWFRLNVTMVEAFDLLMLRLQNMTGQRAVGQMLKSTGLRLAHVLNTTCEGVILIDEHGRITEANPVAISVLGYEKQDLLRECRDGIFDLIDTETATFLDKVGTDGRAAGRVRLKARNNQPLMVDMSASMFSDADTQQKYCLVFRKTAASDQHSEALISEVRFSESAINSLPGIVYMVGEDRKLIRWNRNLVRISGYSDSELLDMDVRELFPESARMYVDQKIETVFSDGAAEAEVDVRTREGTVIPYRLSAVRFSSGNTQCIIGTGIDLVEQRSLQRRNEELLKMETDARRAAVNARIRIEESLREKQVLLEEVHHRVKNNLAIITGLLELQIDHEEDERVVNQLRNNQLRIYSMAAIHEMLYHNEKLSEINFAEYIRRIVDKILLSVDTRGVKISWKADLKPVVLNVNQAIPLAMILNELVSNVCKHAFPEQKKGHMRVELSEEEGRVCLTVEDNGTGCECYENGMNGHARGRLGVTLIQLLGMQLGGKIENRKGNGTRVRLSFYRDRKAVQAV